MQGLNDLYDFKLQHPDADIDPFLKRSTQFFQDYIARGLKSVELERQEKQKNPPSLTLTSGQGSFNSVVSGIFHSIMASACI
jgi:cytoskeleton-associated protein 5